MSRDDAFLRRILEDPDNDTPRLIYADWLEERGDPRGEFVRVQCELASLKCKHVPEFLPCPQRHGHSSTWCEACRGGPSLRRRERELFEAHGANPFAFGLPISTITIDADKAAASNGWPPCGLLRRGFVASISLPCGVFMAHAADLFSSAPLEEVRLTDREPYRAAASWPECPRPWVWFLDRNHNPYEDDPSRLPRPIFALLDGPEQSPTGIGVWKDFPEEDAAHAALCTACVRYGRAVAGLPLPAPAEDFVGRWLPAVSP